MEEPWNTVLTGLVGGGSGTATTVGLVLLGRLVPLRTVERERADRKAENERVLKALQDTHTAALQTLRDATAATIAQKDGEIVRFREDLEYERKAKDVERDRADRNGELLGSAVRETALLLRSLAPTPAARDDDPRS